MLEFFYSHPYLVFLIPLGIWLLDRWSMSDPKTKWKKVPSQWGADDDYDMFVDEENPNSYKFVNKPEYLERQNNKQNLQ